MRKEFPKLKKIINIIIIIILFAVFIYGAFNLITIYSNYKRDDDMYKNVRTGVFTIVEANKISDDGQLSATKFPVVDFEALRAKNNESLAWIWIPGTIISYPIMQGDNNEKYLSYTFEGYKSAAGSIFLDYMNSSDFSDRNNIIYGHNMKDSSMFGSLKKFDDADYMKENQHIYIITDQKVYLYYIFSKYIKTDEHDSYKLEFEDDNDFINYLGLLRDYSNYKAEKMQDETQRIITLSTCVNDGTRRRILHAALVWESE